VAVYTANSGKDDAIKGTCQDYTDEAVTEVELQAEDQQQGRNIETPLMVIWTDDYLGQRGNVGGVWERDWIGKRCPVEKLAVGEVIEHFLPE